MANQDEITRREFVASTSLLLAGAQFTFQAVLADLGIQ